MPIDSTPPPPREPRNLLRLWICVVMGMAIWFAPAPAGLSVHAWRVFAVFAATILSFLIRPLLMGPCVLLGLIVLAGTGELGWDYEAAGNFHASVPIADPDPSPQLTALWKKSFERSLSGFADDTVWLVVASFLISGAMIRTGLGRRVALGMVSLFGRTMLGLGYSITLAEVCLAPFVPSNTARGGGVMAPIVHALSQVLGSRPDHHPERAGRYLVLVGAHANLIAAAMFLTGMAANPLVNKAAEPVFGMGLSWGGWLLGSIVPGLASIVLLPALVYLLAPPDSSAATEARADARDQLQKMGAWSAQQVTMAMVVCLMLVLWISAPLQELWLGFALPTALVALMGVAVLVLLGVELWRDVIGNQGAWDALVWLGGLVTMANALRNTGFTSWMADQLGSQFAGLPPVTLVVCLAVVYFLSMYAFSMLTGHIMAMVGVFLAVAAAADAPPLLCIALFGYFSNLCGAMTNYSTGPVVIYFGLGYVPASRWFAVGFVVGLAHLVVWLGIGLPYWRALGWW